VHSIADLWTNNGRTLYNGCGPTEVSIVNTLHIQNPGQIVSIGRPIPNTSVYVLDNVGRPLPIGQSGIIWASGACVSRGYVGLPEKTKEKWKLDPFRDDW
jgi:non-ribosomal peptide synthetase component F